MAKSDQIKSLQLKMEQVTRTESIFNANQVQKIFNSTPQRYKYQRPAKGGGEWTYVRVGYIRRVLDSISGFNWSFLVDTTLTEAFDVALKTKSCVVKGILKINVRYDGKWVEVIKEQWGRADVKFKKGTNEPLDFGNDMKAAATDALKKCSQLLGIAADVYDPEEFMPIEILGSDEHSEKKKNLSKLTKEAKEELLKEEAKKVEQKDGK